MLMPSKSMDEKVPTKNLMNKTVVSRSGKTFGKTNDLIFDTSSGELISFVVKDPTPYALNFDLEKTKEGEVRIPFNAVIAVGDYILIAEEDL
jgi:sporulation protein YlmC with PRC-barrel domain